MFFDGCYFCMQNHSWVHLPLTHPPRGFMSTCFYTREAAEMHSWRRGQELRIHFLAVLSLVSILNSDNELRQG